MATYASIDGINALERKLKEMASATSKVKGVKAGIIDSAKYPTLTANHRPNRKNPPTVAQVALWNEFGTNGGGWGGPIKERPFMRNSVDKFAKGTDAKVHLRNLDPTQTSSFELTAHRLGNLLKDTMVEMITDGNFEPNKPATIAIKTNNGKLGSVTTPLIDTGLLRNSIDYELMTSEDIEINATRSR